MYDESSIIIHSFFFHLAEINTFLLVIVKNLAFIDILRYKIINHSNQICYNPQYQ